MGKKGKWLDTVQKILSSSESDHAETEAKKAAKLKDKPSFKKLWQLAKSSNNASTSSAATAHHHHQPRHPPSPPHPSPPQPDQAQGQEVVGEAQSLAACRDLVCRAEDVAAQATADTVTVPRDTTPKARRARSKEDVSATRIQAACRGYLARRAQRERGMDRLMSLVAGPAVKRQTEEALYCMQTLTRVQTQIHSRRLQTELDKKALKNQVKIKQSFDTTKIGEGWDHSHQSKEQMEAVWAMKQEAASRRQRALAYAFSNQWKNRNPSSASARAASPPMFMDPGNPNWGWTWTERWMAAARPWESQTTASPGNDRVTARNATNVLQRIATVSVQPPLTPGRSSFRPLNWPSLPAPSTPPPRSPSVSGRTVARASPRSSTLQAASALQRTRSLQPDRQPRSSQERAAAVSNPRCVVPASPRGGGSPLRASIGGGGGLQRATTMQVQPDRRPRSSRERAPSSPRRPTTLLRTTSLRSEPLRRLNLGGAASAAENVTAPVTPSYMQTTTSVRAKARCASPSPSTSPNKPDGPEKAPAALRALSPSSAKKRLSLVVSDKPSTSKAERPRRHSQPPSPRTPMT